MESLGGDTGDNPEPRPFEAELVVQRGVIDEVDEQMVELINRRAAAALEIGRIKAENGLPIYQGSREEEVLDKVCAMNGDGIVPREDLRTLFQAIMKTSRAAQQRLQDEGWPAM